MISKVVAVISGGALISIYGGFAVFMTLVSRALTGSQKPRLMIDDAGLPTLCVYLAALNEEGALAGRLSNLTKTRYPLDRLQIVVVSDGSTDRTFDVAQTFAAQHPTIDITVLAQSRRMGPAAAQNLVASRTGCDILVSTDADSRFDSDTLIELARPFRDPTVGVVGGRVIYQANQLNAIGNSYNAYRRMESSLRKAESRLGVLAKVDGPCVAYRRCIWRTIEDFEDVDQVIVLLARQQGYQAIHVDSALCFDRTNENRRQEIRQRRRMTRKAILSTLNRWTWRDARREPGFTVTLFFHKLLRFTSPLFCLTLGGASLILFHRAKLLPMMAASALLLSIIRPTRRVISSFALAQLSFAAGLMDWARGDRDGTYLPTKSLAENPRGKQVRTLTVPRKPEI